MKKCVIVVTHSGELAKQADVVFRLKKGELQIEQRRNFHNLFSGQDKHLPKWASLPCADWPIFVEGGKIVCAALNQFLV